MAEKSGGPVSYYLVDIKNPNQGRVAYQAECGDIIEALGMTFNEGCAFKAIWRIAAARTLGKAKEGGDALYDAQKVWFYGARMEAEITGDRPKSLEKKDELDPLVSGQLRQRIRNLSFWSSNLTAGYSLTNVDIEQVKTELRKAQELLEKYPCEK